MVNAVHLENGLGKIETNARDNHDGPPWACDALIIHRRAGVVHAINWQTQNRYMQIEGFVEPADKIADLKPLQITPRAA